MIYQSFFICCYVEEITAIMISHSTWICLSSGLKLQIFWKHTLWKKLNLLVTLQQNINICSNKKTCIRGSKKGYMELWIQSYAVCHRFSLIKAVVSCQIVEVLDEQNQPNVLYFSVSQVLWSAEIFPLDRSQKMILVTSSGLGMLFIDL